MKDCIFCRIAKGEAEAEVEGESENVIAFKSISPVSQYHIIIAPKKHIASFLDLGEVHKDLTLEVVNLIQNLIKKNKITLGYKLVINGGKYQSISHLHWHLLGGKLENKYNVLNKT